MPAKTRKRSAAPDFESTRKHKVAKKEPKPVIRLIVYSAPRVDAADDSDTSDDDGIEWEEPPSSVFRVRPSLSNSSLLARRVRTNRTALENSSSGSIIPTASNTIDLITPELDGFSSGSSRFSQASNDSGYCTSSSTSFINTSACSMFKAQHAATKTIEQYHRDMNCFTEKLFYRKFLKVEFPYDPKQARKDLEPMMRRLLDRPEDRPLVPKIYLAVNLRESKMTASTRLVRKPIDRTRDMNTDSWVEDYITAPQGEWDR